MKQTIILFDINETILNLDILKPKFKDKFGDEFLKDTWFNMLLHMSTVSIITGVKTDFYTLSKISLQTLASKLGVNLTNEDISYILQSFSSLPAHSDIKPALTQLRDAGFKTIAFSNSSSELIKKQIQNSNLTKYFDEVISVEEANTFKPNIEAYKFLSKKLNHPLDKLRLVATHDWDTHGAISAGLKAAYINRFNTPYNPLYKKDQMYGTNMNEIAEQIILTDT